MLAKKLLYNMTNGNLKNIIDTNHLFEHDQLILLLFKHDKLILLPTMV